MIDIQDIVVTTIVTSLKKSALWKSVTVSLPYESPAEKFPLVTVEEKPNIVHLSSSDNFRIENNSIVGIEINIYTNKTVGKKRESKNLSIFVDEAMVDMGFARVFGEPMENTEDNTIARYVLRYNGIVNNESFTVSIK